MAKISVIQKIFKTNKSDFAPVYVTFYLGRDKVEIPCYISVKQSEFDKEKQIIRGKSQEVKDRNLIIRTIKARVNNVFVRYRLQDLPLNKATFMREYNNPSDYKSFNEFYLAQMKIRSREIEYNTLKHHRTVLSKLNRYCPTVQFCEITPEWLNSYLKHLKRDLGNIESTAQKEISILKVYIMCAVRKGYMKANPFDTFKIKKPKSAVLFLDEEELKTLWGSYVSRSIDDKHFETLRFFLFLCFTSLHISDAKKILIEQLNENDFTYFRIKNRNTKPEPIIIPLSEPAKFIIKQVSGNRDKGLLFNKVISDQHINKYLKDIAKANEIDKPISAKVGRHTFSTIFLKKTKDITALQKLLGHSSLRETMIYAHVLDSSLREGVQCFNSFQCADF